MEWLLSDLHLFNWIPAFFNLTAFSYYTVYVYIHSLADWALSGIEHEEKRSLSVPGPHVQWNSCGQAAFQTPGSDWVRAAHFLC